MLAIVNAYQWPLMNSSYFKSSLVIRGTFRHIIIFFSVLNTNNLTNHFSNIDLGPSVDFYVDK